MGSIANESGQGITTDNFGNVYVTGYFQDTVDFDPGPGVFNLKSNGSYDIFIQKLDADGNFIWAKQMRGDGAFGTSIEIDTNGYMYCLGNFSGTVDFDPDTSILYGDVNNDTTADFSIQLTGVSVLEAADLKLA